VVAMAGDGQASMGSTVVKSSIRKVNFIAKDKVIAGYAGKTSDCMTMIESMEEELETNPDLLRACVRLGKKARGGRGLEASMIVADKDKMFQLSGDGNVMEPNEGVCAIGSGGMFALAAARALLDHSDLSAEEICLKSMKIAGDLCVYTNHDVTLKKIDTNVPVEAEKKTEGAHM
jgi:ATP-dependent HslUV protease subunit HslV